MNKVILLLLLIPVISYGETIPSEIQKGDCFEYNQPVSNKKLKWIVGKVEGLDLGTWDLYGTLYAKTNKNDKKIPFVRFHFVTSYKNRFKYNKIECPSHLPIK